jgi:hypothetical protein
VLATPVDVSRARRVDVRELEPAAGAAELRLADVPIDAERVPGGRRRSRATSPPGATS